MKEKVTCTFIKVSTIPILHFPKLEDDITNFPWSNNTEAISVNETLKHCVTVYFLLEEGVSILFE